MYFFSFFLTGLKNFFEKESIMRIEKPHTFKFGIIKCSTHTIPQLIEEIKLLLADKALQPRTILCVNAHIYNIAYTDPSLRQIMNRARIVASDGMSIVWLGRLFGAKIAQRCNMTEAFYCFLKKANIQSSKGILIGVSEGEAKQAAINLQKMSTHCQIINSISGFHSDADYCEIFSSLEDIDFIFLGMSTPRTERLSELATAICPRVIIWHIGAGTIKILAGTMKEAPVFWRRIGLQWLHRFCHNPEALWRRYLFGNVLFIQRLLMARQAERKRTHLQKH